MTYSEHEKVLLYFEDFFRTELKIVSSEQIMRFSSRQTLLQNVDSRQTFSENHSKTRTDKLSNSKSLRVNSSGKRKLRFLT